MTDRELLAGLIEGDADHSAADRLMANDAEALAEWAAQVRTDQLLRSLLAPAERARAVRDSILTAARAPSLDCLKARVLENVARWRTAPHPARWLRGWRAVLGFGLATAAAAIAVAVLALRPPHAAGVRLSEIAGGIRVERGGVEFPATPGMSLNAGDRLRLDPDAEATVRLADRSRLVLSEGAALRIESNDARRSVLEAGRMRAEIRSQPAGHAIEIGAPHAHLRVVGTIFSVEAAARRTRLDVIEGMVRMGHAGRSSAVDVAAGEFAVALPERELVAGVAPPAAVAQPGRHADPGLARRPFSAEGPWNRPIPAGARYADIRSEALDLPGHGAVVLPASHQRPVWTAGPADPPRRVILRYEDRIVETLRAPDIGDRPATGTLIDAEAGVAYELVQASRRGADIEVMACLRQDLRGPGVPPEQTGHTFSGLPLLAGIIRAGELETGIPHALAVAALHEGLSRNGPEGRSFVPPARHMPIELHKLERLGATGNVCYGTRLAIPRDANLAALDLGAPALHVARALQQYGAIVSHSYPGAAGGGQGAWKQPHLQFFAELPPTNDSQKLCADISKLLFQLKVVTQ